MSGADANITFVVDAALEHEIEEIRLWVEGCRAQFGLAGACLSIHSHQLLGVDCINQKLTYFD